MVDPIWELEQSACKFFAALFERYMDMSEDGQEIVQDLVLLINSEDIDEDERAESLYDLMDVLYPTDEDEDLGVEKIKGESDVPCENCSATPTHLVKINQHKRTESHYLCEKCEKDIDKMI